MLSGEVINMELITEKDASFIINLRNNSVLSEFISPTSKDVEAQKTWIRNYKIRENKQQEFYYIISDKEGERCGCVRIYDLDQVNACCTFGSFILHPNRPNKSSYDVFNLIKLFVEDYLGLEVIKLKVFRNHSKAIYLYKKVGFTITHESEDELFFELKVKP